MSNIYIQEPSTKGKVLLVTSVGDLDIELWSKEAPKACRNFVQLCMEGYYNGTIFHRLVKNFIVQGGDPSGTGTGGESIYGAPFKDEFHSRLRFVRRGLVAMANAGPHDNASQFFFTLAETPELQNKHTIFGKITGPTLYNMLKLQETETDSDERPLYPHKIIKTEILSNPFDDIVPRMIKKVTQEKEEDKKLKSKSKATKNFSLLSFGEEAEEDEEQTFKASKKFSGKSKSSHDLSNDPRLSSETGGKAVEMGTDDRAKKDDKDQGGSDIASNEISEVRNKLKREEPEKPQSPEILTPQEEKKKRSEQIRHEQKKIKKELKASKRKAEEDKRIKEQESIEKSANTDETDLSSPKKEKQESTTDFLEAFKQERKKYKNLKKSQSKKGKDREEQTLSLLNSFKSKLTSARQLSTGYSDSEEEKEVEEDKVDESNDISWLKHKLKFEESTHNKVLDANVTDVDRYDVFDPRNPLTQRRRESSKKKMKER